MKVLFRRMRRVSVSVLLPILHNQRFTVNFRKAASLKKLRLRILADFYYEHQSYDYHILAAKTDGGEMAP